MTPGVALTLLLQVAMAVLMAAFGVAALRVAPRPGVAVRQGAWFISGASFALVGMLATLHNAWAVWAVQAGTDSGVMRSFLRWMPAANDARSVAMLVYALLLTAAVFLRRPVPRPARTYAALALALAVGAVGGALGEGGFVASVHFLVLAAVDTATVVLLLATLYRALVTGAMDYLLWIAIAIYAAREALTVNFKTLLAWFGIADTAGSVRLMLGISVASLLLMIACTTRRLAMARAGREVPPLLERVRL